MKRLVFIFCLVLLSIVAVRTSSYAVEGMGSMPMPAASAGQDSDSSAPWRVATFVMAALALAGIAITARSRRPATIAVFVLAAVLIAALAFLQARTAPADGDMNAMDEARGTAPVPVTTIQIGLHPSDGTISSPANLAPYLVQNITARVPGVLTNFTAYAGDRLRAGDIVARLDEPELQSNAQAAVAAERAAQSQVRTAANDAAATGADVVAARERVRYWDAEIVRERALLAAGAVSIQEYQDERAQAASAQSAYAGSRGKAAAAESAVQTAQDQAAQAAADAESENVTAGYANVIVPDDSIVVKRLVDPGVYVAAGTPILQVAVVNRVRVQAQVAQQDLRGVHAGIPIDVVLGDGRTLHGRVSSVWPVADPATHTAIAEAIVENAGAAYQPGGYARAILHVRGRASFAVPSAAVVGGARTAIWTNVRGMAHRLAVTVLSDDGTTAQIRGDIHPGDRVVVTGAAELEEGQSIAEAPR